MNQYTQTASPSESLSYDADGNLDADGTYDYEWDAENRLIEIVRNRDPLVNGDKKLEFAYDYMGRRMRKTYYTWDSTGSE